jgi:heme oxygenase
MTDSTTIRVPRRTRDHLAQVARERGTTLKGLVEELAAQQLTADQIADRAEASRQAAREVFGVRISGEGCEQGHDTPGLR